ncbi:hypothetical protein MXZ33_07925 [Streptococcus uberis]|uniref:hypothetical protein n=1 Tax=Streptococcus uberis TaxID=1349 RepID=UPI001FF18DBB|nr:hypothetical protein [Streptococcus uberis]MCK1200672.1 hypothetical protein [Streptococcus uberis]MCK1214903.1 hypothetical protein [Streptococcus uberis]
MEIKQKHGKHALRKAVTAAVLAGTAFSSSGGFIGAVKSVKADENSIRDMIISYAADRKVNRYTGVDGDQKILDELRVILRKLSVEDLHLLLNKLDTGRYDYGMLSVYERQLETFTDDTGNIEQRMITLTSLIIKEVQNRIKEHEERGEALSEKEEELKNKEEQVLKALKEKEHLESELDEKKIRNF